MSTEFRQLLREELWRSIAWAALALTGWAFIITENSQLEATVWTVLGFPLVTWAFLTVGTITLRLLTGSSLQVRTTDGLHLAFLLSILGGGFAVFYLIAVDGYSAVVYGGGYLGILVLLTVYYWFVVVPDFESRNTS